MKNTAFLPNRLDQAAVDLKPPETRFPRSQAKMIGPFPVIELPWLKAGEWFLVNLHPLQVTRLSAGETDE